MGMTEMKWSHCKTLRRAVMGAAVMLAGSAWAVTPKQTKPPAKPAGPVIPAGSYATERGVSTVEVTRQPDGRMVFRLISSAPEAQTCLMQGELKGRAVSVPTGEGQKPCEMRVTKTGSGFKLEEPGSGNVCRQFCGPRAEFAGTYLKVKPACLPAAIHKEQELARVQIENKAFVSARDRLRVLARDCQRTMDPWTESRLRNDFATAQLKLGDLAGCRQTLEPLKEFAARNNANIRMSYPQAEADMLVEILTVTRDLLEQCPAK